MRIDLLSSGLIDDLVVDARVVRLTRSGDAKYRIETEGEADLWIEVWTTRKSRLLAEENDPPPEWVGSVMRSGKCLDQLEATNCLVHLEQMHRRSYFLGLSRERDSWGMSFSSPAYAKARLVSDSPIAG